MKKFHLLFVALLLCCADIHAGPVLSEDEQAWLSRNSKIILAVPNNASPFIQIGKDGQAKGYAVDYLRLVCSRVSLKLETVSFDQYPDGVGALQAGKANISFRVSASFNHPVYLVSPPLRVLPALSFSMHGAKSGAESRKRTAVCGVIPEALQNQNVSLYSS